ncbi:MAG: copper homeostasis protein CutC [Bacteroidetes bacterium]|nr:MAG: copper homeostasis protein CutC [Bacteroidota bacterium]TNE99097.1 MAG: copper homeostasis protein CutC [Bacteroidota bacterium]
MKVELCAASLDAIKVAKDLGFDRIELCQTLEQGGLTPSPGMIEYALAYGIETHVLIRPRPGGFIYSEDEIEIVLRDVRECKEIGANGVVVGILDAKSEIHVGAMERVKELAGNMQVTFHRAFDDTVQYDKSMDILINLEIDRILSSGLCSNVDIGMPILKEMKRYASGSIEIMVGGGVNLANLDQIIREVNPDAVHFSATRKHLLDEESYFSESILKIDPERAKKMLDLARS